MLAGASISRSHDVSRRQHCVTMSSTEAELVALADCAIELLYVMRVLEFIGYEIEGSIEVYTDNKGAHDLCHRYSAAQHSRHIDRKLFKMRVGIPIGESTVSDVSNTKVTLAAEPLM